MKMNEIEPEHENYPWAGPLLFLVVLIAIVFFFSWLVG